MKGFGMALVLFVLLALIIGLVANFASAAGGGFGNDGTFNLDSVLMQSNSNTYGDQVSGSFSLSLDADKFLLDYTSWTFYTYSYDTSRWTASCNLHGKRNSQEEDQSQYWSQSYTADVVDMSASINLDCYGENDNKIDYLLVQVANLQDYLTNNPDASNAQEIHTQILLLQIQVLTLQQNNKNMLNVSGNFGIEPSELEGSSFNWQNTTECLYSYPNGYEEPPVVTEIPTWRAEYRLYGQFLADTPEMADAMGLPFVQSVPEPTSFVLMLCGIAVAILRRRQYV